MSKLKVAVVEDHPDARQILTDYFEDEGFEVIQGRRPEEVADQIAGCAVAVIDVQIKADDISPEDARFYGIQYVLRAKKEGTWNPCTRLVFISNFEFDYPATQFLLKQIGEYTTVEKPLQMMKLRYLRSLLWSDKEQ